jgi:inhibitor of cysteine peptidase
MKNFLILMSALVLSSCSMFSKDTGEVISKPLTAVDSNREVVLPQNHIFRIVLPSNPTTGYTWNVVVDNPNVVSVESSKYLKDSSGRVGVGGETTWLLMAQHKGNATLLFSYQRVWEEDVPPTRVVKFLLNVR